MIWSPMVKLGLSEVIGSWKIIASRLPRRSRRIWSEHFEQIEAVEADRARHFGGLFRQQPHDGERRDALAAAGFADQAERRASGDAEIDAVDRMRGAAVIAVKGDAQIPDLDQRRRRSLPAFAMRAAMPASITARSVIPAGFFRLGRYFRKCTQRSRLTASSRSSSARGSVWSSTRRSSVGPFLFAVNQKRGRLLAALVAASRFARAHRRDQALRKRQLGVGDIGFRGVVQHPRRLPAYCRQSKSRRPRCARTSRRSRCRYRRRSGRWRP